MSLHRNTLSANDSRRPGPIVYLGPSLSRQEAEAELPGGDFRPPIRRGDLYRDRARGGSLFVLIDGAFFQHLAVPPREIVDVLRDGALVVGASSMGALRAAECWPAGLRGVGTIYRLFRRELLTSDDEVAVAFDPESGRALSVALVNVRHAVAKALRRGHLTRHDADALLRTAEKTFYADRTWQTMLSHAGIRDEDSRLERLLASWDLKRDDARRALKRVARWLAADPGLAHRPRPVNTAFTPSELTRERRHDPLAGLDPAKVRHSLGHWHLLSGRYTHHALTIAAATPGFRLAERLQHKDTAATLLMDGWLRREERNHPVPVRGSSERLELQSSLMSPITLRLALAELWMVFMADEATFADGLWRELQLGGELDAELFRWRAIHEAAARARALGLSARPRDRYLARTEMAHTHGFTSWPEWESTARMAPWPWSAFLEYAETLALAKRMRGHLFQEGMSYVHERGLEWSSTRPVSACPPPRTQGRRPG